ncbi:type 2 isopentenyl-diphosphate Delta-isomerase [Ignisphaera sp. 4213-co]|uniref:Isopentenyl-diphosphate delta-isomerase n=1 Tax=Ignisphaera cupida TaxID=3050454 RepID=A0ABD4Z6L6_9CREN|nr:type 2 isopentenyl-diphosphate Delta-isomerase [Ignisphaera sp. 4213-co]MDK6028558.1 type 2 isopentenyl-diphosphate Delta-isomerase [Ignisphaera sp. 4213-co]
MSIENRKQEHIEMALTPNSQGPLTTLFEDVILIHNAIPNIAYDKVDTSTSFLGYKLGAPIIISGMTGGTEKAYEINRRLAELAEEFRIAIGVGSQRAMIENPSLAYTYKIVREVARSVPVIANIGFAQIKNLSMDQIESIVSIVEANALAIHLNPAQELVQIEGDRDFENVLESIEKILSRLSIPVIIKEIGNGLSKEVAEKLYVIGVKIFDVAGAGGTNWVRIELMRSLKSKTDVARVAEAFISWGIPTAASICEVRSVSQDIIVIGSGGIRSGVDIAKAISLGADLVAIAQPILKNVLMGKGKEYLNIIINQLKIAMSLVNVRNIDELKQSPMVITGKLAQWICARKLKLRNNYAYIYCYC